MNKLLAAFLIAIISIYGTCSKTDDTTNTISCDGLITDTAGTGDNGRVYMPRAFSPNNDGLNDISRPITQNIASIVFTIYDEGNNIVFTTTQLGQGWTTTVAAGTSTKYYYRIQAITINNRKIGLCGELFKLACFPSGISRSYLFFEDQLTPYGFTGVTAESLSNCP